MKPYRIALLAPLKRALTKDVTASRSRVLFDLARTLVKRGHTVTVFGTGDSVIPNATVVPVIPTALTKLPPVENPFYQHTASLSAEVKIFLEMQDRFDIVHNHMYPEYYPFLAEDAFRIPMLTTIHSQMTSDMKQVLQLFPSVVTVAISNASAVASGNDMPVVYNGIDTTVFCPSDGVERTYLLFVGRMSKAKDKAGKYIDPKGVITAIEVAKKSGKRLKIVGNVEDRNFYDMHIAPNLSETIEFVGDVSSEQTVTREDMVLLFQGAIALINPINWEEPFGLVMAEAMACGTPVVAFDRGSVRELVLDKETGYVVSPKQGVDGLVDAVSKVPSIDKSTCRRRAETLFSLDAMVNGYELMYAKTIKAHQLSKI
jgi:glycosyltransferase involved in cell wall biosynthesis